MKKQPDLAKANWALGAIVAACLLLANTSPLFAQQRTPLLIPGKKTLFQRSPAGPVPIA